MADRKNRNKKSGMILSEIFLAGAIISFALASAVIVIGSMQSMVVGAEKGMEAQLRANAEIAQAHLLPFDEITSFQKSDSDSTTTFSVSPRNAFTTNISADISWYEGATIKHRAINDQIVDWQNASGAESCDWLDNAKDNLSVVPTNVLYIESGNLITDVSALGDYLYVSANGATSTLPDLYVIDVHDIKNPVIVSRLNTGPGIASVATAGHYVYVANAGSFQMQIIDVADPIHPVLISQAKLAGAVISGTAGFGQSVHYFDHKMYIGLTKNAGPEFFIIDVINPHAPILLDSFETGSMVNDIDARDGFAVVVTPGQGSVILLNTKNPQNIFEINRTTLAGWQTQGAQSVEISGQNIFVGRTLGGFYSPYSELMVFDKKTLATSSADIKTLATVENILSFNDYLYVVTNDDTAGFRVLHNGQVEKSFNLFSRGVALTCNNHAMYVVSQGFMDFLRIFASP